MRLLAWPSSRRNRAKASVGESRAPTHKYTAAQNPAFYSVQYGHSQSVRLQKSASRSGSTDEVCTLPIGLVSSPPRKPGARVDRHSQDDERQTPMVPTM